jgi:hypothetical protein
VDAVCRHHRPEVPEGGRAGLDVLAITHIADGLAGEVAHNNPPDEARGALPAGAELLNHEYLAKLGVEAELPAWRAMAQEVHDGPQGG